MPATLVFGKGFRIEQSVLPSGEEYTEVLGIDGGQEPISWASVTEMEEVTARYGIGAELWPIYRGCEIEAEIPLEDAEIRSSKLRTALAKIGDDALRGNYWLSAVLRILQGGNSFFIMP